MNVRVAAVTAGVAALAGGLLVPIPAVAEEPTDAFVVATGQLLKDGHPVSGDVAITIWPNESVLGALAEGAMVPLLELPATPTAPNGQFNVTVPADLPAEYVGEGANVDVEVIASDGTAATSHSLTTTVDEVPVDEGATDGGTAGVGSAEAGAGTSARPGKGHSRPIQDSAVHITLDVGEGRARAQREQALTEAATTGAPAEDAAATPGIAPAAAYSLGRSRGSTGTEATASGGCTMSTGATHGPYMEQFAAIYGTAYVKGRVRHEYATTNTVGVGVKYSGSSTWSAGGTQGTSGGFSYDTQFNLANTAVSNKVMERYYHYACLSNGVWYRTTYTRPAYIHSGPYYRQIGYVSYSTCETMYAGVEYRRVTNANGAFSAGLDLPFINLSAQSGWTETTEIWFRSSRTGKICGSSGQPWTRAPRISPYA